MDNKIIIISIAIVFVLIIGIFIFLGKQPTQPKPTTTTTTTPAVQPTCGRSGEYCGWLGQECCQGLECKLSVLDLKFWSCESPVAKCSAEGEGCLLQSCCEGLNCEWDLSLNVRTCKRPTPAQEFAKEGESCAFKACDSGLECVWTADPLKLFKVCGKPAPQIPLEQQQCGTLDYVSLDGKIRDSCWACGFKACYPQPEGGKCGANVPCQSGLECKYEILSDPLSARCKAPQPPQPVCDAWNPLTWGNCATDFLCRTIGQFCPSTPVTQPTTTTTTQQIYCAQDTFRCADDTYVSRDPNNKCQFRPCPYPSTGCQSNWQCSDYGLCIGGQKTRTCIDGCGNTKMESQQCGAIQSTTTTTPSQKCWTEQVCNQPQQVCENKATQSCSNVCGKQTVNCDATYPCDCSLSNPLGCLTWDCVQNPLCKAGNWLKDACNNVCSTVYTPVCTWTGGGCYDVQKCG